MKTATKIVIGSLIIIPLVAGSAVAGKRNCGGMQGPRDGSRVEMIQQKVTDRLELNSVQQEKLAQVAEQAKQKRQLRSEMRKQRPQLVKDGKFDRVAAQQLVDRRTAMMQQHAPQMIAAIGDFYDSLSPEQQSELAQMRGRMKRALFGRHAQALR